MRLISQQIRVFDAVIRRQSYTKAARELRMTQPGVTHHMRLLESMCGVKLVERVGNKVVPTEAGLTLHETARQLIGLERDLEDAIKGFREGAQGSLAIGTDTTGGMNVLLKILRTFREGNPGVDVRLTAGSTAEILSGLTDRVIDLGVVRGSLPPGRFESEPLCADEVLFVVSRENDLAGRDNVTLEDAAKVPLILPGPGSTTREYVAERFRDAGLHVRIAMEFESTEHAKKAVEGNLGAGLISRWVIEDELRRGSLVSVDLEGFPLIREYRLVRRKGSVVPPVASRFLETVALVKPQLHFS